MLRFKYDYVKKGTRSVLGTTVNDDLLMELKTLSIRAKQPMSKMLDVMIMETLKDEESVKQFVTKVRNY